MSTINTVEATPTRNEPPADKNGPKQITNPKSKNRKKNRKNKNRRKIEDIVVMTDPCGTCRKSKSKLVSWDFEDDEDIDQENLENGLEIKPRDDLEKPKKKNICFKIDTAFDDSPLKENFSPTFSSESVVLETELNSLSEFIIESTEHLNNSVQDQEVIQTHYSATCPETTTTRSLRAASISALEKIKNLEESPLPNKKTKRKSKARRQQTSKE